MIRSVLLRTPVFRRQTCTPFLTSCQARSKSSTPQGLTNSTTSSTTSAATSSSPSGSASSPSSSKKGKLQAFGQPLPKTHPHLMGETELTPGISAQEYESRRTRLMKDLPDYSTVIVCGARTQYMSQSIFYKFRQSTDFWYLMGWNEPDSAVILEKDYTNPRGYRMIMFVPPKDPEMELWDGARTGPEGAMEIFGADEAHDISNFTTFVHDRLTKSTPGPLYMDIPNNGILPPVSSSSSRSKFVQNIFSYLSPSSNITSPFSLLAIKGAGSKRAEYETVLSILTSVGSTNPSKKLGRSLLALKPTIERLRTCKSPSELALMKQAGRISGRGHIEAMRVTKPGIMESRIANEFDYTTFNLGAQRAAYVPVVASGPAALTLHYTTNDHIVQPDTLVLIDAGCEYNGYASDITRTFPASGKFTSPQRDLYNAVLEAQRKCVKLCTQDQGLTLNEIHRRSCDFLRQELKQLSIDAASKPGILERILYPHFIGHPLGIDLHDTPTWERNMPIREGMVLTIEPGLYVPPDSMFPEHFHNIGIRIEDMVYVGKDDVINLSANAPKEVDDIEAVCQNVNN